MRKTISMIYNIIMNYKYFAFYIQNTVLNAWSLYSFTIKLLEIFEMNFQYSFIAHIFKHWISSVIKLSLFGVNHENARDQFFALFEFHNPICSRKIYFNPKRIKTRERINF